MISSRKIEDLSPQMQVLCRKFLEVCNAAGHIVILTSTYRDAAAQDALYAQGRTKPGKIVTNARAGQSAHNWRAAFDFAPLVNGEIPWNDTKLWTKLGHIGQSVGLEWAGAWTSFKEMAHLQDPTWKAPK